MPQAPLYRRVLLKLSGEALMGEREYGLDTDMVSGIARDITKRKESESKLHSLTERLSLATAARAAGRAIASPGEARAILELQ